MDFGVALFLEQYRVMIIYTALISILVIGVV